MATSQSQQGERRAFLRFARKALLLLPAFLVVPVVNYSVDPANLFAVEGAQEEQIGKELLAGKNVVNFERYADRRIATYLLRHRTGNPDVLILGSSRTLNIGSYLFPKSVVVNGSMLASTLREVLAAYHIVSSRRLKADTVIVGIDPWMLNADAFDERWTAIRPEFEAEIHALGIDKWPGRTAQPVSRSRFNALVSLDYFQQAVRSIGSKGEEQQWYTSATQHNTGFTRVPDGSYTYSEYERTKGVAAVDERARRYTARGVYMLGPNSRVDNTHLRAIVGLLSQIRRDGSTPVLFLPPYHPIVFNKLAADPQFAIVTEAEKALRQQAGALGVTVVGSYNPAPLGLSNADFYDGHHLTEAGLRKVFGH